jgi:hypothetical protein
LKENDSGDRFSVEIGITLMSGPCGKNAGCLQISLQPSPA